MAKESRQEVGTLPGSWQTSIHIHPSGMGLYRSRMLEVLFNAAMAPVRRVQVRRVGGGYATPTQPRDLPR
jgi:hypothetical protein